MRTTTRIAVAFLAVLGTSTSALAGGIGLISTAGLHQERAYYYGGNVQAFDSQSRPNYGVGLEGIIGDKDDKIQGILQMAWVKDSPASNPDTGGAKNVVHPDYDSVDARDIGVIGLGVQWGILGDPSGGQLVINSLVGSGFITTDNTEFVKVELGVGGTWNFTEAIQGMANVNGVMRARKRLSFGPSATLGIRYLFD